MMQRGEVVRKGSAKITVVKPSNHGRSRTPFLNSSRFLLISIYLLPFTITRKALQIRPTKDPNPLIKRVKLKDLFEKILQSLLYAFEKYLYRLHKKLVSYA
ncbi:hypothetical protein L1887_20081 [Cichorium endivia]|nr:hypothetical protein L1887_20081 [Cichorium endivia]